MNISAMEKKIRGEKYNHSFDKFLADIELIHHNCCLYNVDDKSKDIRYMSEIVLSDAKYLLKFVIEEVIKQIDNIFAIEEFHKKYITKTLWLHLKEDMHHPSSVEFFKDLLVTSSSVAGVTSSIKTEDSTHHLTLTIPKVPKSSKSSSATLTSTTISNTKINRKSVGGGNATAATVKVEDDSSSISTVTLGKGSSKKRPLPVEFDTNMITEVIPLQRSQSIIVTTEWGSACHDMFKKVIKHEFVDITRIPKHQTNTTLLQLNFFAPVIEQQPSIADAYLSVVQ